MTDSERRDFLAARCAVGDWLLPDYGLTGDDMRTAGFVESLSHDGRLWWVHEVRWGDVFHMESRGE